MWSEAFERARSLALEAHRRQCYGSRPYSYHLEAVAEVLERFGASLDDDWSAPILAASWLHDAVEDTGLEVERIRREVGDVVAELVWRVTDEPGESRRERKAATYGKIAGDERAVVLKLADRIANVEESSTTNPGLFRMYEREHAAFEAALRPVCASKMAAAMWAHLDGHLHLDVKRR